MRKTHPTQNCRVQSKKDINLNKYQKYMLLTYGVLFIGLINLVYKNLDILLCLQNLNHCIGVFNIGTFEDLEFRLYFNLICLPILYIFYCILNIFILFKSIKINIIQVVVFLIIGLITIFTLLQSIMYPTLILLFVLIFTQSAHYIYYKLSQRNQSL